MLTNTFLKRNLLLPYDYTLRIIAKDGKMYDLEKIFKFDINVIAFTNGNAEVCLTAHCVNSLSAKKRKYIELFREEVLDAAHNETFDLLMCGNCGENYAFCDSVLISSCVTYTGDVKKNRLKDIRFQVALRESNVKELNNGS